MLTRSTKECRRWSLCWSPWLLVKDGCGSGDRDRLDQMTALATYPHAACSSASAELLVSTGDTCRFILCKNAELDYLKSGPARSPSPSWDALMSSGINPNLKGDHRSGKCCAHKNWPGYYQAGVSTLPLFSWSNWLEIGSGGKTGEFAEFALKNEGGRQGMVWWRW